MCDPVTIGIMLATTAAKAGLDKAAANKVEKKRSEVMNDANASLDALRGEARTSYQKSANAADPNTVNANIATADQNRTAAYTAPITQSELLPGQGNASDAVKQAIVGSLAQGVAKSKDIATKRAAYDAYGDAANTRDLAMTHAGQDINQVGNFEAGRSALVPGQLEMANHAGDRLKQTGDMVQALGTIASMGYGMSGPGQAAAVNRAGTSATYGKQLAASKLVGPVPGGVYTKAPSFYSQFSTGY